METGRTKLEWHRGQDGAADGDGTRTGGRDGDGTDEDGTETEKETDRRSVETMAVRSKPRHSQTDGSD